jgi:choline-glycine betaine transporter
MIYIIAYLTISAAYGYFVFRKNEQRDMISPLTTMMFGTTWGLHLTVSTLILIYNLFGVKIYYMVAVDPIKEKEDDNI